MLLLYWVKVVRQSWPNENHLVEGEDRPLNYKQHPLYTRTYDWLNNSIMIKTSPFQKNQNAVLLYPDY